MKRKNILPLIKRIFEISKTNLRIYFRWIRLKSKKEDWAGTARKKTENFLQDFLPLVKEKGKEVFQWSCVRYRFLKLNREKYIESFFKAAESATQKFRHFVKSLKGEKTAKHG